MSKREKLLAQFFSFPREMSLSDIKKILKWYGFELDRVKGSHHIFTNDEDKIINFPVHDKKVRIDYLKQIAKTLNE